MNLHARTGRIEDMLAKTRILKLADNLDDREIDSLLRDTVSVRVPTEVIDDDSGQLTGTAIE